MIRSILILALATVAMTGEAPRDPTILDARLEEALAEPKPPDLPPVAPPPITLVGIQAPTPVLPVASPILDLQPADYPIACLTLLYPNAADIGNTIRNLFGSRVYLSISDADNMVADDLRRRFERFDIVDGRTQGIGLGFSTSNNNNGEGGSSSSNSESTQQSTALPTTIGIDTILVTVLRRQNRILVRTGDDVAMIRMKDLIRRLDVPTPQVLLEVRMVAVEIGDGFESFFDYQGTKRNVAGAFANGAVAQPTPPSLLPGGTGLRTGDLIFQFVNDHFAARMQLLESKKRISVISSPLLLTSNNEVSRLFVGREVPLNRTFNSSSSTNTNNGTQQSNSSTQVEFRPVGTTLLITPNINADRSVTLRIVQERSDADSTATLLVPSGTGFTPQEVNIVSSQTVSGTIVAKSGLAVAFGGLIEEGKRNSEEKVPLLGSIPMFGFFFRRQDRSTFRREIVVMVRPHVLSTPAESEAISRRVLGRLGVDPVSTDLDNAPTSAATVIPPSFLIDPVSP